MASFLGDIFNLGFNNKYERIKFYIMTLSFAFVIGSYTIAKELKDSIFVGIVGKEYLPKAKFMVIFLLIPAAILYSRLVDKFRRYQLLSFYSMLYGLVLLVFALFLGHSSIGLANTDTGPHRIFGWLFYFFLEGYSPFVVSVFWAFANSVTSPGEAKNHYPVMVAGSKVGGILTAFFAWQLLSNVSCLDSFGVKNFDVVSHQILMLLVSGLLLCVPLLINLLMRKVPGRFLHGYEAVYKEEKKMSKSHASETGVLPGVKVLLSSPYILGIFGLVFFYETLNVVLNFQRILLLKAASKTMASFTASMFKQRLIMHGIGSFISFFGVQFLFRRFGERVCLLIVPVVVSCLVGYLMFDYSADTIMYVFIGLGTLNYSLSYPLREVLYIPTMKDMKFKAKAWIDTFGTKFSKGIGSVFADFSQSFAVGSSAFMNVYSMFFGVLLFLWFMTSWLLGKRYEKAINNNEVIGKE